MSRRLQSIFSTPTDARRRASGLDGRQVRPQCLALVEDEAAAVPTALYAAVLLMSGVAYTVLQQSIIAAQGPDSLLKKAVGTDWKGKASLLSYVASIPLAFVQHWLSLALIVLVALMWFVPDRRIERVIRAGEA